MIGPDSCGAVLKQIHDIIERQVNNSLKDADITMAQLGLLLVLNHREERQMTMKELEKNIHVAQSTTVGLVSRLEQKGMVESIGDPEDRRVKIVRITEKGLERCRTAEKNMDRSDERIVSHLTKEEADQFNSLLRKVRDGLLDPDWMTSWEKNH